MYDHTYHMAAMCMKEILAIHSSTSCKKPQITASMTKKTVPRSLDEAIREPIHLEEQGPLGGGGARGRGVEGLNSPNMDLISVACKA